MKPLRISLITPSRNQGSFIGQTVESVLQQRGDFELEYLVLDGGSTDGTLEILRGYGQRLRWTSEPDGGPVDALNKGLRAASGDIVGWLNSDDLLAPGALQRVAAAFASRPALEWLHGGCDIIDARNRVVRRWITAYKTWCCRHYSYPRLLSENFISQMTVFWRRGTLGEIGYLDPTLKLAFDYDLWLRLGRRSEPLYIPERQASFRWYESSKSGAGFEEQLREAYAAALRYAPERRWLLFRKRVKTWRTLTVYRALRGLNGDSAQLQPHLRQVETQRARNWALSPFNPDKYNEDAIHFSATRLPPLLAAALPPGPLALADLGCGDGRWFRILERRGCISPARPVYAVDLDQTRLGRVARRFPYITTIAAPAEDVSAIASASLDMVISTDVLEHVPDEARFLGEIRRILKPGGKAYLTSVLKKRWAWYFRKRNGESVLDTSHLREYTDLAAFRALIAASGLVLLRLETRLMWFPLVDPLAFRILPKEWAQESRAVRAARLLKVPIAGYYHLNCVLTR